MRHDRLALACIELRYGHIPVVDKEGDCVGVVSIRDIVQQKIKEQADFLAKEWR